MKRFNIFYKIVVVALSAIVSLSCQDEIDLDALRESNYKNKVSTQAPTITAFYSHNDYVTSETPTPLSEVNTGEWIVVQGENLEGVTSVLYNNEELDLSDAYAQWDMMVVAIPEDLPTEINHKFKYTTALGSAEDDLNLILPAAIFSGVENEFQLQGETTKIIGKNFSIYGFDSTPLRSTVVLTNDSDYSETLTVEWCDDENLKVIIPTDAPNNSYFEFILDGVTDAQRLHYRPTDCLLFGDAELTNGLTVKDGVDVAYTDGSGSGDPESLISYEFDGLSFAGKYFRIVGAAPTGWYSYIMVSTPTPNFTLPGDKTTADYYFVFELNTANGSTIPVGNKYGVQFPGGASYDILSTSEEIDTNGEWVTYRVDMSKILTGTIVGNTTNLSATAFAIKSNIEMTNMDHSFANFRIESKNP